MRNTAAAMQPLLYVLNINGGCRAGGARSQYGREQSAHSFLFINPYPYTEHIPLAASFAYHFL